MERINPAAEEGILTEEVAATIPPIKAKFVKVKAENRDASPKKYPSAGQKTSDEIIIE